MGTVSRVHTFSSGAVLTAAQLNNEFDNLLTSSAINGGLDATNLGVTAGQVTASKALVVDASRDLDDGTTSNQINNLILSGTLTVTGATTQTGALSIDDTTNSTSTTTGSIHTDGGMGIALDLIVGDDVKLLTDSSVLSLGVGSDATLTHDGTTGLTIAANPITVDSGDALTLDAHTGIHIFKDAGTEVLRFTEGNSGDVTIKLATNGKDLIFTDNGDATGLKVLDAAAGINVPGEVQTTKIAYTDGDDAITIADGGGVTTSGTLATTGAATLASLVCTAAGTFGGGYGATGATISTAGVGQFNGALTTDGVLTGASLVCTAAGTFGGGYGDTGATISTAGVIQANGAITSDGAVTGATLAGTVSTAAQNSITSASSLATVGTIGTGVWQGTAVASAYLDADTAHLSTTQTFTGDKTFTGTLTVGADDTGKDVKFFGASAGAYMEWDESADQLRLMGASADATTSTGKLLLATSLTDINANDVLGKIDFQAPHEAGGTDAITIAASIQAIAQGTFSASVNATDLIFYTGHSEAATEKFRMTSQGELGVGGANYGTDGQVLTSGGAGAAPAWEDASGGSFSGPGSSTDNAVIRFNGTGGATGQNSGLIVDDSNNVTGAANLSATGNISFDGGSFVFNDAGADKDFRIEGDSEQNLFIADASTDRIGIGDATPLSRLDVTGGASANTARIVINERYNDGATEAGIDWYRTYDTSGADQTAAYIRHGRGGGDVNTGLIFGTGTRGAPADRMTIGPDGETTILGKVVLQNDTHGADQLLRFNAENDAGNEKAVELQFDPDASTLAITDTAGTDFFTVSTSTSDIQVGTGGDLRIGNGMLEIDATGSYGNANMSQGITINQASSSNEIIALKSNDIAHKMTNNNVETDTYATFKKTSDTVGGLNINSWGEADSGAGFILNAACGEDTNDATSSVAPIYLAAFKNPDTTPGARDAVGTGANVIAIVNGGTARVIVKGDGTVHASDTSWATALDDMPDALAGRAYTTEMADRQGEGLFGGMKVRAPELVQRMEDAGIVTHAESEGEGSIPGHRFLNVQKGIKFSWDMGFQNFSFLAEIAKVLSPEQREALPAQMQQAFAQLEENKMELN